MRDVAELCAAARVRNFRALKNSGADMRIQMETVRRSPISFERAWGETRRKPEQISSADQDADQEEFKLSSESFPDGGTIPDRFAEESGVSPQLSWSNGPPGTQSFVIIMDDP